jgi:hypothetical protein
MTAKEFKIKDHDDFIFPQHIVRGLGKTPEIQPKTALEQSREPSPVAAPVPAPAPALTGVGEAPVPPVGETPAPAPTPPPPVTGSPTGVGQGMPASHGGIASVAHVSGDANVLAVKSPAMSSTGQKLVPQTSGDPNYYATPPQFNKEKGYWYSGGTNPPSDTGGWAQGQWVKQGHAQVHNRKTNFWVWYPPASKIITITPLTGRIYALTQSLDLRPAANQAYASLITDAFARGTWRHVFSNPDYYVASFTIAGPPVLKK